MQDLATRHEDRARRIVANGSEVGAFPGTSVGTVANAYRDFILLRARLGDDDSDRLEASMKEVETELTGVNSLAEAPDGSRRTMAGIGVVNTNVVPAGLEIPEAGNGGGTTIDKVDGWGANESPASYTETLEGSNLAGEALQEQDAGSDLKASGKQAKADRNRATEEAAPVRGA